MESCEAWLLVQQRETCHVAHKARRRLPCQSSSITLPPASTAKPSPLLGLGQGLGLTSSRRRRGSGEGESPLSASHARRVGSGLGSGVEQVATCARAPPAEARRTGKRRAPLARGALRDRCKASYNYNSSCSAHAGAQRAEQPESDAQQTTTALC